MSSSLNVQPCHILGVCGFFVMASLNSLVTQVGGFLFQRWYVRSDMSNISMNLSRGTENWLVSWSSFIFDL